MSPEGRAKRHKGMPATHALISVWRVLIFIQHAPRKAFYPKKNATDEKPYFVQHGFIVLSASPGKHAQRNKEIPKPKALILFSAVLFV